MRTSKTGQYRLKDKKAQLYTVESVSKPGYMPQQYYIATTPAPTWCFAQQLSQALVWEAKVAGASETRLFVLNQGTTVKPYDFVYYENEWYRVTRVDTTDDYNTDVYIYVEDAPMGDIPDADHIKPYGWTPDDE